MASAKNAVIAGNYMGQMVYTNGSYISILKGFIKDDVIIDKYSIESYEVMNEERTTSAASGIARGMAGGMLFGGAGAVGGALSAKSKGIYQVAILFKDGKRSLLEIDDKTYKTLIKVCF